MHRSRRSAALLGAAALAGSLVTGNTPASGATETTTYVVLASDAATVDAAVAAVEAAGGQVSNVNRAIGLVTASSSDASFAASVTAGVDVAGVARNTPIGSVPAEAEHQRDAVEKEGRAGNVAAPLHEPHGDDVTAEPLASFQWDMEMMDATPEGSYREQPGRPGVLVGIIDTGVDGTHPDIAPNFNFELSRNFTTDIPLIDGPCEDETDGSCEDAADVDDDGHGTHVAGTIGAAINGIGMAGVAPGVTLVNLRAGQDSGYFFLSATVDALTYAGDNGIDVVNMSFYVDPWLFNCRSNSADSPEEQLEQATIIDATQRALTYARNHGVTLIAALGNEHQDLGAAVKTDETSPDFPPETARTREVTNDCLDMPTEGEGVIAVSSVGPSGKKADYSNHGLEQNDVAAPGGYARDFFGTPQYGTPENRILGPYPTNVAIAAGAVDPVTGAVVPEAEGFVIAECSAPSIDACAYWQFLQGTSMASPHAAGVAALIVSEHGQRDRWNGGRTMDPGKVEKILRRSATDVACPGSVITYIEEGRDETFNAPCVGTHRRNSIYGDGIVNALRAVD